MRYSEKSDSGMLATIHRERRSETVTGAGEAPGCVSRPGWAERAVTRPSIGLFTCISTSIALSRSMRAMSASPRPNSCSVLRAAR